MRRDKLLIISGSRDWTDEGPIRELLVWFDPEWTLVMHGKCRGADMIADRLARALGFTVMCCPADWDRYRGQYPNPAGPIRNKEMAIMGMKSQRHGVAVHAGIFPLPQSKGTKDMYRLCQLGGFDIHIPVACKSHL